jgi:hypothetical protein
MGIPVNLEAMLRMISSFSLPRALYAVKRRVADGLLHAPCRNGMETIKLKAASAARPATPKGRKAK